MYFLSSDRGIRQMTFQKSCGIEWIERITIVRGRNRAEFTTRTAPIKLEKSCPRANILYFFGPIPDIGRHYDLQYPQMTSARFAAHREWSESVNQTTSNCSQNHPSRIAIPSASNGLQNAQQTSSVLNGAIHSMQLMIEQILFFRLYFYHKNFKRF